MIKVKYNSQTGLVIGYFPDEIFYPNNIIDNKSKTIDGNPYIEIDELCHQNILGKTMLVVDGVLKELRQTEQEILELAKSIRILSRKQYLNENDKYWIRKLRENINVPENVIEKSNQARAEINEIEVLTTLEEVEAYNINFE